MGIMDPQFTLCFLVWLHMFINFVWEKIIFDANSWTGPNRLFKIWTYMLEVREAVFQYRFPDITRSSMQFHRKFGIYVFYDFIFICRSKELDQIGFSNFGSTNEIHTIIKNINSKFTMQLHGASSNIWKHILKNSFPNFQHANFNLRVSIFWPKYTKNDPHFGVKLTNLCRLSLFNVVRTWNFVCV